MPEGGNDKLFMNLSKGTIFKGLQQGFQEHEKEFSKFTGAAEQRDKRIDEKLDALLSQDKEQDAIFEQLSKGMLIDSAWTGRVSAIEIERKKDRERRAEKDKERTQALTAKDRKRNIVLGIGIMIATALPDILYTIFVGG